MEKIQSVTNGTGPFGYHKQKYKLQFTFLLHRKINSNEFDIIVKPKAKKDF